VTDTSRGKPIVILGVFVADTAYRAERQPRLGETLLGNGFALGPGGKGSNQAVAAGKLGAEVTFITRLGRDPFAEMARQTWRAAGVREIENARTGQRLPLYPDVLDDIARHATGTLDVMGAAARLAVPWLIVHGKADEAVSHLEAEALEAASGSPETNLLLIDGAGHTFGARHPWEGDPPHFRQVLDATLGWFAAHLA